MTTPVSHAPLAPLTVPVPGDAFATAAYSRSGNLSLRVGEPSPGARARLAAAVGLGPGDVVYAEQVHGPGVAIVGPADRGRGATDPATAVPGVDALVTTASGVGLAVLAADCVPLLLVDPGHGVAAVHAGRRGVASGVVPAALAALAEVGSGDPGRVLATIGPAIGGCCYEVPDRMAEEVATIVPAARARTAWGTSALDLPAGVRAQLAQAGVTRVQAVGECTNCGQGPWFSARAAGSTLLGAGGRVGRHAGIVCRSEHAAALPSDAGLFLPS